MKKHRRFVGFWVLRGSAQKNTSRTTVYGAIVIAVKREVLFSVLE